MKQPVTINDYSITQSQLALFIMAKDDSATSVDQKEKPVKLQVDLSPVQKPTILKDPASYHERSKTRSRNPYSRDNFIEYRSVTEEPDYFTIHFG